MISDRGVLDATSFMGSRDERIAMMKFATITIVILNINGYYDHFIAQLEKAVEEHFMGEIHSRIWNIATTPAEALEIIRNTPRWDASVRKYAAI